MIGNRATLKRQIPRSLNYRGFSDDELNDICDFATARINQELRVADMLTRVTITVTKKTFFLPNDFLEIKTLRISDGDFGKLKNSLSYVSPEELLDRVSRCAENYPQFYTNYGTEIEVAPYFSGSTFNLDMFYYGRFLSFDSDEDTNQILAKYPNLYLNLCCIYGSQFMLEPEDVAFREGLVAAEFARIRANDEEQRIGAGPLIVRPSRRIGGRFS